jgi:hypothetical protein
MDKSISFLFYKDQFRKVDILRNGEILYQEDFHDFKQDELQRQHYYFMMIVSKLKASDYVKFAHLDNKGAIIKFDSCTNRNDLDYTKYFSNVHKISKLLFDNVIYLLKELPFLNTVSISIPYRKYELLVEVDRKMLELFLKKRILIRNQDVDSPVQPVKTEIQLTEFIQKFVKVIKTP